ncbi:3-deoxy-manno-octulosonate cytidylyltransferase (CMP-KDO synthetase) [Meinhardsimonia xiamenensis]|jgi:3-deoxy-manno-octulosonate cytidylyltransferase (CMP-KDO synthetase)|uniref:3-deoxy-manno-octulosonate cytidylyltransferase (CMP-KDO synthetase) n=1 Tax=Meinhardsimonia xiamenensis TaxID=990712 RepID=A0A1G9DVZ4_9RHOB|nr:manno-octulosonate cytidylyltransferase [Meinhardsimonia xiamenensis]PRX31175.1 3-deoxy-manno-octulosonate cytidylyltransferase (CMP-KDO synthetase) [Meinhardsimonia xiamenensis]SDK68023.1 3-deoxy-manno-octulosonate cytidylyltransferase (CMP-KDO synthetase) [Meinhardsimonia xiamenensis]
MSVLLVIPARHASTRYPGKPLARLTGPDGVTRTLLELTWAAAQAVPGVARAVVATDDERIAAEARRIGAEAVMTSPDCRNGTERVAEAVERLGGGYELVVNLQGDAPLTPPWFVTAVIEALAADPQAEMATPVLRCDGRALRHMLEDRAAGRPGATTAVFDAAGRALYFSKEVIPHASHIYADDEVTPVYHHVGLYAFRPDALEAYRRWPVGRLEALEGLEQLRFLENGARVLCVEVEARGRRFWELNNPEDVARIEAILAAEAAARPAPAGP